MTEGKYGWLVLICVFCNSLISALYISRQNYLNDIIWALPISSVFVIMSLFCLDYYNEARRKKLEDKTK